MRRVAQLCEYTKESRIILFKRVASVVCEFYLNKAALLKNLSLRQYESMKGFQADDDDMVKNDAGDYVNSGWKRMKNRG